MKLSEDKMWEAWGRTNALYTYFSLPHIRLQITQMRS